MGTRTRVVTDPDTKVLNLLGTLLENLGKYQSFYATKVFDSTLFIPTHLVQGDDLAIGLLNLS